MAYHLDKIRRRCLVAEHGKHCVKDVLFLLDLLEPLVADLERVKCAAFTLARWLKEAEDSQDFAGLPDQAREDRQAAEKLLAELSARANAPVK